MESNFNPTGAYKRLVAKNDVRNAIVIRPRKQAGIVGYLDLPHATSEHISKLF
jgi:hypothetical protein